MGRPKKPKPPKDIRIAALESIIQDPGTSAADRMAAIDRLDVLLAAAGAVSDPGKPAWWDDPNPFSSDPAQSARWEELHPPEPGQRSSDEIARLLMPEKAREKEIQKLANHLHNVVWGFKSDTPERDLSVAKEALRQFCPERAEEVIQLCQKCEWDYNGGARLAAAAAPSVPPPEPLPTFPDMTRDETVALCVERFTQAETSGDPERLEKAVWVCDKYKVPLVPLDGDQSVS